MWRWNRVCIAQYRFFAEGLEQSLGYRDQTLPLSHRYTVATVRLRVTASGVSGSADPKAFIARIRTRSHLRR
jgi:hypothetical protein